MNSKKVGISIAIVLLIAVVVGIVVFALPKDKEEIIYKVTFNNDGVGEVIEVKEENTVTKPADPEREGYDFDGWYYNGTKFDFTTIITKDITLEARWIAKNVTKWEVTFDTAGGKPIDKLNVVDGEKIDKVPTPEKGGYKFIGWYYNEKEFDFEQTITKNITLVAKWQKEETPQQTTQVKKYTVKFDTDGGSKVDSKSVENNKTVSKPSDPTRDGYVFIGWYYNEKEFDFKTKITKNITLVAKWKKIETPEEPAKPTKYTVKFDTDGGSAIADKTVEENQTVTKPSDPTRDGYTFIGWYYNDTLYSFSTLITSNITLTAKWEKNSVITYKIEEIPESYVGQVRIFILKDGIKVDGYVDITTTNDKVVTKEISKDGYVTNGAIIASIDNVKVK